MLNIFEKIKKKMNNFLKKLGEANQENLGNGRLDCCDLNKDKKTK